MGYLAKNGESSGKAHGQLNGNWVYVTFYRVLVELSPVSRRHHSGVILGGSELHSGILCHKT